MTITREQVADLRPGDVVEVVRRERFTIDEVTPDGRAYPWIGDGEDTDIESMTVMYRAPRPLYVNHERTEPVSGDVVRDADSNEPHTWMFRAGAGCPWYTTSGPGGAIFGSARRECLPDRLRLLVDGETGRWVP